MIMPQARLTPFSSAKIMQQVMLALLPGFLALFIFYGIGHGLNLLWTVLAAIIAEAWVLAWRKQPILRTLSDGSALLTALLLALALPAASVWWVCITATLAAILLAKHVYGGLGNNLFNPAMVGYAFVLVCFPQELIHFPAEFISAKAALLKSLGLANIDGYTSATVLTLVQQNSSLMMSQLFEQPAFGMFSGVQSQWINAAFLIGGGYLILLRIISWHVPLAFIGALSLVSLFYYDGGSSASSGSALFHVFAGGTLLTAFFILTDPVTGCASKKAQLAFGALAGVLVFMLREYGHFADGLAFAVLMANMAAPLLDRVSLYWENRT